MPNLNDIANYLIILWHNFFEVQCTRYRPTSSFEIY